jgi:hypothetical protein
MKFLLGVFLLFGSSCSTIHFRSNNTVPVTFEGNPKQKKEISIEGHQNFYFWGTDPEHHVVYVDEEVRKAGYNGMSKLIIYENKEPTDILISFLTLGFFTPRAYTITGFVDEDARVPVDLEDTAPPSQK